MLMLPRHRPSHLTYQMPRGAAASSINLLHHAPQSTTWSAEANHLTVDKHACDSNSKAHCTLTGSIVTWPNVICSDAQLMMQTMDMTKYTDIDHKALRASLLKW